MRNSSLTSRSTATSGLFTAFVRGLKHQNHSSALVWPCAVALALVLAGTATLGAAPLWVSTGTGTHAGPTVETVSASAGQMVFKVEVPGYEAETVTRGPGSYVRISLPGCGFSSDLGEPQLSVMRRLIEVPEEAQLSVSVQAETRTVALAELGIAYPVLPRQQPVPKIPGALKTAPFDLKAAAYEADAFAPASPVSLVEAGRFAGRRLVLLEVSPIAYNPARGTLNAASQLTVTVTMQGGGKAPGGLSAREDAWLARLTLNHAPAGTPKAANRLLIIAHDSLAPNLSAFIAHKSSLGWAVDLADTTAAGTTTNAIRAYIQSRYADLATRPAAVLLAGDTGQIPCFISAQNDNPVTDLYYGCMDTGDDWQPEIAVGRFSATSASQLDAIVHKTISYETSAPAPYLSQAAFMATADSAFWSLVEGTHNWVITNYMEPRGYLSDKLYCHTYGTTSQQVRNALNHGRVLGIYSGHGSETAWGGPAITQSDVRALTNAGQYPFICSFACFTGKFNRDECFAETWQRCTNSAAVEVLASSVISYWHEDEILEKALFEALFDQGHWLFGDNVLQAKALFLQYFGVTPLTRRYFEQYNAFGDPTVALRSSSVCIASSSPLPPAFVNEPYSFALVAVGGTRPYAWSITGGALPDGLSLDAASGLISGIPTNVGAATFTAQVSDAFSATTNIEFQLPVLVRLQVISATNLPPAIVGVPYSTTLLAQGGTPSYKWSADTIGSYAESDPGPGWLGGGTAQGWHADEQTWRLALPWPFPYYGTNRTSAWICSNGYLDFGSTEVDFYNWDQGLIANARIAPLWEDLVTTGTGDDIFVTTNASFVAIRWVGHTRSGTNTINAEVVLYRDGSIQFNYGPAHSSLPGATIGLSAGDGTHYTLSTRNNATSIPADVSSLFSRTGVLPPGLSLTASGLISGTLSRPGGFTFNVHLADSGTPSQDCDETFHLDVASALYITSASPLPTAFLNEPYTHTLTAAWGMPPYTNWSITSGSLPEGLSLDPALGIISGVPRSAGASAFTVRAVDAAQATASRQLELEVLPRLQPLTAGNLPLAVVNTPYYTALLAQGGTPPYVWSANVIGAYVESDPGGGWLGGGTAQSWCPYDQDESWSLALPWPFPYYGANRTSVWVCSNGYLDFDSSTASFENSDSALISNARIAPLWEDLVNFGTGDGIFITTNDTYVAIRWEAYTASEEYPVNAEAVLHRDGAIQFNYGPAQSGLPGATIGLSAGDGTHYTLSTRDDATFIPANVSSLFSRTGVLPPRLSLAPSGLITGTPTQLGTFTFNVLLADSGTPGQTAEAQFRLEVVSAPSIAALTLGSNNCCFISFNTVTGRPYCLEYCGELSASSVWFPITNNLAGTDASVTVCDPDASQAPQRFYRLRMW